MALREYHCDRCGIFEVIEKFNQEPLEVCPTCGGLVKKLISMPGLLKFIGSGFYCVDYGKKHKE